MGITRELQLVSFCVVAGWYIIGSQPYDKVAIIIIRLIIKDITTGL